MLKSEGLAIAKHYSPSLIRFSARIIDNASTAT